MVAMRTEQREPISPETGSRELRAGSPRRLASDCLISLAMSFSPPTVTPSARVSQMLDLRRAALHRIELAEDVGRLRGDGVRDVGQHAGPLLGGRMLRAAEPAGRRDRADVGEDRLVAAGAAELVHLVAMRGIGRIVDAVEMDQVRPIGEHRQRLDLAAVGEAVAGLAVKLLSDVAG